MDNCASCKQPDCHNSCPELKAAQARIKELEAFNWAALNSELQSLKIWKNSVILAVTGEQSNVHQ